MSRAGAGRERTHLFGADRSRRRRFGPLLAVAAAAAVMIYFQMYWHVWLLTVLKGHIISTLWPIAVLVGLASLSLADSFARRDTVRGPGLLRLKVPLLFLVIYVAWATGSVVLNEPDAESMRRYLIYVYSPVTIFLAILVIYRIDAAVRVSWLLAVLVLTGIILSVYVAWIYGDPDLTVVSEMSDVEGNRMTVFADSGGSYGMDAIGLLSKRFTIPGLSSTTYGPILVPLVVPLLLLAKHSRAPRRFVFYLAAGFLGYCVLMTVSRGPILALMAAFGYVAWRRVVSRRVVLAAAAALVVAGLTVAKLAFLRVIVTVVTLLPFGESSRLSSWAFTLVPGEDPRLLSVPETIGYALQHPLLGLGMSRLIALQEATFNKEHNNYLAIAAAFGIAAAVAYVGFLASLVWSVHRRTVGATDPRQGDFAAALAAGTLALCVYTNFSPAEFHFVWVWYGLVAAWVCGSVFRAGTAVRQSAPKPVTAEVVSSSIRIVP